MTGNGVDAVRKKAGSRYNSARHDESKTVTDRHVTVPMTPAAQFGLSLHPTHRDEDTSNSHTPPLADISSDLLWFILRVD